MFKKRFRTARYDFIERPESPKASVAEKNIGGGGDKGDEKGTHEPIQDMPSSLTLLVKVSRSPVCVCLCLGRGKACFRQPCGINPGRWGRGSPNLRSSALSHVPREIKYRLHGVLFSLFTLFLLCFDTWKRIVAGACRQMDLQIYRNALRAELAEMRESRKTHALNLLKTRVASARAVTSETR